MKTPLDGPRENMSNRSPKMTSKRGSRSPSIRANRYDVNNEKVTI